MKMLEPLDFNSKLEILSRLSNSLKTIAPEKKEVTKEDFFADLKGGWKDGVSTEEVMDCIRNSRMSNSTRPDIEL